MSSAWHGIAALAAISAALLFGGCATGRALLARSEVRTVRDVEYVPDSRNPKQRLDLYLPKGRSGFPIVHFVHGGYWRGGDRRYLAPITGLYGNFGYALARHGIGVVVQSYRLAPEVGIDEELEDVLEALRWTLTHIGEYGGDATRVVLAGYSAGGHMITLLGVDPGYFKRAGIDPGAIRGYASISGIVDLVHMAETQGDEFNAEITWPVFGRDVSRLRRYSPVAYFDHPLPPFLFLFGGRDYPYIREQTAAAVARLAAAGQHPRVVELEDTTHPNMALRVGTSRDRLTGDLVRFVEEVTR